MKARRALILLLTLLSVTSVKTHAQPASLLTNLWAFNGTNGAGSRSPLLLGSDGWFYGTSDSGGSIGGWGTVFKVTANGALTSLYSFSKSDGAYLSAGLTAANDGTFYGATSQGGSQNDGTIFKITTNGLLTTLHQFSGTDGATPFGG